jgi:hypothetical protein
MVLLLPGRVPQVDEILLASDVHLFILKRGVHCRCLILVELILAKLQRET